VHYPTDTIGGAFLGLAWFCLTAAFIAPLGIERTVKPNRDPTV
jgi:membrane-associated phospholipid phosphatase